MLCCVFPVRLSWLFVVFGRLFWLLWWLVTCDFSAFCSFCGFWWLLFLGFLSSCFVLFFFAYYSFGMGGFWAVCWYWYLVSPCSFQPSRNIWIRRVRSMPRFIVSMARLKHTQALWQKSLTLLWTSMTRTRSVYDMWPFLWILYETLVGCKSIRTEVSG